MRPICEPVCVENRKVLQIGPLVTTRCTQHVWIFYWKYHPRFIWYSYCIDSFFYLTENVPLSGKWRIYMGLAPNKNCLAPRWTRRREYGIHYRIHSARHISNKYWFFSYTYSLKCIIASLLACNVALSEQTFYFPGKSWFFPVIRYSCV